MSLSSIIRAVAGGPKKTRAEGDQPEENMEDDMPVTDDEENTEGDEPQDDEAAEGDQPEEEGVEGDEDEPKAASWRNGKAAGCKAERSRMAAILGNPAADANPGLAAHLAFATDMKAADAVAALKAGGVPAGGKLAGKMAGANQPRLGGSPAPAGGPQSQPDRIAAHAAAIIEAKRTKRSR
jgi:hypothetical protein